MRQPLPSHFERGGVPKAGWGLPETDRSAGKKELRIPHYEFRITSSYPASPSALRPSEGWRAAAALRLLPAFVSFVTFVVCCRESG